ncbi:FAD-dependent oxidoreductase [Paenibacillus gansuensis]|uniref:FAD-dependent oxidoreductase n=1 Tax=Paenibacillus gansuensis TaxID=306542 RepID=A0ABW5PJT1_9BACL
MRVGIIGGGIGGLTLAQALRARNIDVAVFERDAAPSKTAGYRLHISGEALAALREGLPARWEKAVRASGTGPEAFRQFSIMDHRGKTRFRIPAPAGEDLAMIGRVPLRTILSADLGDIVKWGTVYERYTELDSGVELHFANVPVERVDVLVGADGVRSLVARQLLGKSSSVPAGIVGIAGKTRLTNGLRGDIFEDLFRGPGFAIGPKGVGAFITVHAPSRDVLYGNTGNELIHPEEPYVVWSMAAPPSVYRSNPLSLTSRELIQETLFHIRRWEPGYIRIVEQAVPESAAAFPFSFPSALGPWTSPRVTLIGDAIHPMPPTAGLGASTAMIDAITLAKSLVASTDVPAALEAYQKAMLQYAPRAVDEARPPLLWQRRFANPLLRVSAMHVFFPIADALVRAKTFMGF